MASRHLARSIVLQSLYEWDFWKKEADLQKILSRNFEEFGPGLDNKDFVLKLALQVADNISEIDNLITKTAPHWPLDQIATVDRNVLRIGLSELLYSDTKEVPPKVAIDEAIELAKNFAGPSSGKFINGVMGTVYDQVKEIRGEEPEEDTKEELLVGGFIFKESDDGVEVALVLDVFDHWTLPKGHREEGESLKEALIRELEEETGLTQLEILDELGHREYTAHVPLEEGGVEHITKKVTDFLVRSDGTEELVLEEDSPGLKDVQWFPVGDLFNTKHYKDCESNFKKAIELLQKMYE